MVTISLYKVVDNVSFDEEKGVFSDNVSFGEQRLVGYDDMRINQKREVLSYKKCNWHGSYEFRKLYKFIKQNNYPTIYIKNYTIGDDFPYHYSGKYLVVDEVFCQYDPTKYFSKYFFMGGHTIKYVTGRDNIINSLRKFISYKEDKVEREETINIIIDYYDKVSCNGSEKLFLEIAW